MDVSITSVTGTVASPTVPRLDSPVTTARHTPSAVETNAMNTARLNAVRDLIASLTGREVILVPPSAYFVSAPTHAEAVAPVELLAPMGLAGQLKEEAGPVEVDITSVLRTGTAERMLLEHKAVGQLQLRAAVDLEL